MAIAEVPARRVLYGYVTTSLPSADGKAHMQASFILLAYYPARWSAVPTRIPVLAVIFPAVIDLPSPFIETPTMTS